MPGAPLACKVAVHGRGGFQELAGSQALAGLARELGVTSVPSGSYYEVAAALVARAARAADDTDDDNDNDPHRRLLRTYATRLATGRARLLVSVLDPELGRS